MSYLFYSHRLWRAMLIGVVLSSLGSISLRADELPVKTVTLLQETPLAAPLLLDSTNVQGKAFAWESLLERNAPSRTFIQKISEASIQQVKHRDTLTSTAHQGRLRYFGFTIDASQYTPASIKVKGAAYYKVYVNGTVQPSLKAFEPQRYAITLAILTPAAHTDTFDVRIEGKDLTTLTLNAGTNRPYTMQDMLQGLRCNLTRVSPSGRYLMAVYSRNFDAGKVEYYSTITEISSGKTLYRTEQYSNMTWLPTRDVCYFTQNVNGQRTLSTFDPSTQQVSILAQGLPEGSFTLSPTGDYLIINGQDKAEAAFKNGVKLLTAPDDRMPGYRNRNNLFHYNIRTQILSQLTFGHTSAFLQDIKKDGSKILFTVSRPQITRRPFAVTSLFELDMRTLHLDTLLTDTPFVESFRYAPNGKQLLVKASPEAFGGVGSNVQHGQTPNMFDYQLYLFTPGQTAVPLTCDFAPSINQYLWSQHDGKIYFSANDKDRMNFFSFDPKSREITQIPLGLDVLTSFSIATQSGRMVYQGQWAKGARNLYTIDLDKPHKSRTQIGDIDFEKTIEGVDIAPCYDWDFVSTRGDSIYGRYYLPPHFDKTKQYPMIVYYYGGCVPTERYFEFRYPFQVLASQGYVVYVLNPAGATGFGQKFAAEHVNAWGKNTADDIIQGTTTFAAQHPFVNKDRIGCMGASYGGFMTQYLVAHTDIFATAISHAGISNIASYWGGGYWGYSYGTVAQANSYPWNNAELYVKQSPLFRADSIHTPLLLLHGTKDTNVPTTESLQLFTALKLLGREVAFIEIQDEDHIIMDYNRRMAWQNAIFAWFAKYLKEQPTWWNDTFPQATTD